MTPSEVEDLVKSLDAKIQAELPLLEAAAENVRILQGHETEPLRWYADAMFLVLQVDLDMMVNMRTLVAYPAMRVATERELALHLCEAEAAVGSVLNGLAGALRAEDTKSAGKFDLPGVDAAIASFKGSLKAMRADTEFMANMTLVRNTAAAHLWGREGGRLNGSAQWVLSRKGKASSVDDVFRSKFVIYGLSTLGALHALSADLRSAFSAA